MLAKLAIAAVLCGACTIDEPKSTYELGTFPYHPLVYELDLAILAYQVHGRSPPRSAARGHAAPDLPPRDH